MAKMTKAQRNRLHDLQMLVFASRDMIYRAAPGDNVPFADCYRLAPQGHKEMHDFRVKQLADFETALVASGRGYRDAFGHFQGSN